MEAIEFLTNRSDITKTQSVQTSLPDDPPAGHVLVAIDKFGLTANNITYAASGDALGYWNFFPAQDPWGKVPVWGYGDILASSVESLKKGERLYGYFPIASHVLLHADRITPAGFSDLSPHRAELAAVYNHYVRTSHGRALEKELEDAYMTTYPLYATSYVLYDFLLDNDYFGAKNVIVSSASSKTSLGLLELLSKEGAKKRHVIGLTSQKNKNFVEARGWTDAICLYDAIDSLPQAPSVYVDMSGNMAVREALHHHLSDNLKHSSAVGMTHWDKFQRLGKLPGAQPSFFFAPSQIAKRRKDWGAGVLEKRTEKAWRDFIREAEGWFQIESVRGTDNLAKIYSQIAAGAASPHKGYAVSLQQGAR